MRELARNCFHILMVPVWKRKYLLASGCLVWAMFYVYLHFLTSPVQTVDSLGEGNVDVSLTTGSLSAKLPVDMDLVNSRERGLPSPVMGYVRSGGKFNALSENLKLSQMKSTLAAVEESKINVNHPLSEEDNAEKGNGQIGVKYFAKSMDVANYVATPKNPERDAVISAIKYGALNGKSVKDKFISKGLKPTVFHILPKHKMDASSLALNGTKTPEVAEKKYIPALRLVHFDLKGAHPRISYFKSILPLLKAAGANGILMEYEDTFPFWGSLGNIHARNAYTPKDIMDLLEMAKSNGLEVIPLVQTFGHLEFALKLKEFKHLREVVEIPQALCPTNNASVLFVKTMIDQVMAMHADSKWLHIGSDEVYQLGQCKKCSKYDRNSLFLTYVKKIAKYVRGKHKVVPIMWDDMLRHITISELEKYEMGRLVEPMVWTYVEDVYLFIPDSLWEKYSHVFPNVWAASAFKGAFGETLTVPDAKRHLENNRAWLKVMNEQKKNFQSFRGIAVTGWQRYDHFASLCELLPAGLPSLVLDLLTVSQGGFSGNIFPQMQEILDCSSRTHYRLDLEHDPYLWRALAVCFFPGSPVFRISLRHHDVTKSLDKFVDDISNHKGWLTEYNINHNFSSPMRINELLREFSYQNSSLYMLQEAAIRALGEVFDDFTVNEWIELNIYPYAKKMKKLWEDGVRLKRFDTWPRRPFPKVVNLPTLSTDFGALKS